jgi:hypothetical protein
LENVVPVRPLAIWFAADGVKALVVERNTEYVTPLVDDAVQLRLICVEDTAVAVKPVGGAGTPAVQLDGVVADAWAEDAVPAQFTAWTT